MVIGTIVILLLTGYFLLSYQNMIGTLESEAEINSRIMTQIVVTNPKYWQFERVRLMEYLSKRPSTEHAETRRVVNTKNEIVAESSDNLESPLIMRSSDIMHAGVVVGKLEIYQSLRPLLKKTCLILLLALSMDMGVFFVFIRDSRRAEMALKETNEKLEAINDQLQEENAEREGIEKDIFRLNEDLEAGIVGRTAQLETANQDLETQTGEHKQTEKALIESEKKYRLFVENSSDIIYSINLKGYFTYANPVAERIMGWPRSEIVGKHYLIFVRPDFHDEIEAFYKKQYDEQIPSTYFEFPIIVQDGSTKWIGQNAQLLSKDDKNIGFQAVARDITARKRAEEALRESEEKYLLAFESTSDGIFTIDRNFNISSITPSVERQLGYKVEEVINRPIQDLNILTLESLTRAVSDVIQVLSGVEVKGAVYEFIAKDGTRKIGEVTGTPIIREGKILGVTAVVRDITERKRIEETLAESEKKYRELVDFLPISLFETDIQGNVTSANPAIFETFGYTQPDFEKSLNGFQMIIPDDQEKLAGNIQRLLNGEWKGPSEYTGLRKDGSTFPFLIFPSVVIREGKPVGLRGAIIDLTDRKRIEESLKKSNLSLAEAQRIAHIGNWEWNIESDDMYCSDEISRIVGAATPQMFDGTYEAFSELVFPEDREMVKKAVEKAMHEGATSEIEHRIVRCDGAVCDVRQLLEPIIDDTGKIVRIVGIVQDVTEKNQVERDLQNARDQLLQSEKLASMGRLSAGVAHEILNPVSIISLELQILQTMENPSPEVLEELEVCMAQISRIVIIAENLKQFSRISEKKMITADINGVIAHVLTLYATQLKIEGVEIEVQYQSDLPAIAMDREKIEQVILNLITNALAAMEGKEKKVLRITTEKETVFGDHDQLKITIADTGTGIKSEHMSKIFDPFFTTKGQGKGTGLGLSISYGIVHDHGGMIWAENNEWGGASFYVRFPLQTDI